MHLMRTFREYRLFFTLIFIVGLATVSAFPSTQVCESPSENLGNIFDSDVDLINYQHRLDVWE